MQYLLDSNVLITANSTYYEIDRIPHFWDWIARQAVLNTVKLPEQMMKEITPNNKYDTFLKWLAANSVALTLNPENIQRFSTVVLRRGYGINESEQLAAGFSESNANDAILVAHALADKANRKVVTLESVQETGNPLPLPRRRKIPLVCRELGVECINTFDLIRELDFKIEK